MKGLSKVERGIEWMKIERQDHWGLRQDNQENRAMLPNPWEGEGVGKRHLEKEVREGWSREVWGRRNGNGVEGNRTETGENLIQWLRRIDCLACLQDVKFQGRSIVCKPFICRWCARTVVSLSVCFYRLRYTLHWYTVSWLLRGTKYCLFVKSKLQI